MHDWIGWAATAVFSSSYFFRNQTILRLIQALAALLWIGYGMLLHSAPVILANLIVAGVAGLSAWKQFPRRRRLTAEKV